MTATISLPRADYNRAKALAEDSNMTISELFIALLEQFAPSKDDSEWDTLPSIGFNPHDHTQEEIDARFDEIEEELETEEGITHEQMMEELKKEFSWL